MAKFLLLLIGPGLRPQNFSNKNTKERQIMLIMLLMAKLRKLGDEVAWQIVFTKYFPFVSTCQPS